MIPDPSRPAADLGTQTVGTALLDIYTVPPRFVANVMQIDVCNISAATRSVIIKLRGKYLFFNYALPVGSTVSWNGFHAVIAGDKIQAQTDVANGIEVLVSGTLEQVATL